MENTKEKLEELRKKLTELQQMTEDLMSDGVVITFTVSSDQKVVDVRATQAFSISCKATINQEL